ncbi:MAG: hypothetical protein M0P47_11180 [Bacteroidales bacterium]|nr:hypothetical protein [Bacteroidales bacterium]
MRLILTFLYFFSICILFGQNRSEGINSMCCCSYFKNDTTSNFCYWTSTFSLRINGKLKKVYESTLEFGLYSLNKREGICNEFDEKNNLIGQNLYINGIKREQHHYLNGKLRTIIKYRAETMDKDSIIDSIFIFPIEFLYFNKKGKIVKHVY